MKQNWQKTKQKLLKITDKLGCEIDSNILDLVVSLNVLEINTSASCEGHPDHGCANPWIDIESKIDVSRLIKQGEKLNQKADQDKKLTEEQKSILWQKARKIFDKASLPNLKERQKLIVLLDEFYKNHRAPFDAQLHIMDYDFYCSRLENNGASLQDIRPKKQRLEKLKVYQKEMQAFSDFLKKRYFGLSPS